MRAASTPRGFHHPNGCLITVVHAFIPVKQTRMRLHLWFSVLHFMLN